eukprot:Gb_08017 [translate_table: standard]
MGSPILLGLDLLNSISSSSEESLGGFPSELKKSSSNLIPDAISSSIKLPNSISSSIKLFDAAAFLLPSLSSTSLSSLNFPTLSSPLLLPEALYL